MINRYAFGSVPPFAQGPVRDLRVRRALEEAGLLYRVTLVGDRPGEPGPLAEARPGFTKALAEQMMAFAA